MSEAEAYAYDADMRKANRKKAVAGRSVIFKIKRCDGPGKPSRWESFKVPIETGANVISSLNWIAANPVTTEGAKTTPVVWDSNCLEEVCGACTMVMNGQRRTSPVPCTHPRVDAPRATVAPIGRSPLEPMSQVPRRSATSGSTASACSTTSRKAKAWVPIDGTWPTSARGPRESQDNQETPLRDQPSA